VNLDAIRRMADAVLYEGYILYPYRASAQKNRSRWQWGVLMAPGYVAADPSETDFSQCEVVLSHGGSPSVQVILRFLQVQRRTDAGPGVEAATWDEAVEREIEFTVGLEDFVEDFAIDGGSEREGLAVRRREPLAGAVSVQVWPMDGPWQAARLRIRVENRTAVETAPQRRDDALPTALVAAHMIISAEGGEFISMTDPPMWAKAAVADCENIGGWPVLADPDGGREVMLSAPIILYDHPELAPESPGELYDGTEIDEILTLRTLALSDAEKAEARATDPRAAALIDRVEGMDAQTLAGLHGTIRPGRPAGSGAGSGSTVGSRSGSGAGSTGGLGYGPGSGEVAGLTDPSVPWWDPGADASVSPDTDSVTIAGQQVARGSRVRLRPGARRSDAQDMFLVGRMAEVQAVLLDVDDKPYLAVSLADDPNADISIAHGRFLYFSTDEVEPCEPLS